MAECVNAGSNETESMVFLREKLRTEMKISRQKHRHDGVDTIRIAIGETYTENLRTYTQDDVLSLAKTVKHQKHANPHQLNQLSHAFLQSTDNIQCFLNVTGALNVIVKELIGSNSDTQSLAIECICNLSLGSEISCEKVTLHVATYLITFLKSSNERLLRTSLWTITNLTASGNKSLKILIDQEVIKSLISINTNAQNDELKKDALKGIDVAIDGDLLRTDDVSSLIRWIQNFHPSPIMSLLVTKILYKLLNKLDFQWHEEDFFVKVLDLCTVAVFHLHKHIQSFPIEFPESISHIIILLRIIGNLLVTKVWSANYIIENGFAANNVEIAQFFKDLLAAIDNDASQREILWLARNLLENNFVREYLNRGDFDMNALVEYWCETSKFKM